MHKGAFVLLRKTQGPRDRRVGIYSGTFDPVHAGHITFALQARQVARLDQIVFLPERLPRHKPSVEHFGHRVAMLERALRPYPDMAVLELADKCFSVQRTWPQLQYLFAGATLVLMMGSDAALQLPSWPEAPALLRQGEFVIGARKMHKAKEVKAAIQTWSDQPQAVYVLESFAPNISSTTIRSALAAQQPTHGLLTSVRQYAQRNWLYAVLGTIDRKNI